MNRLWVVFSKEVVDNVRDRRTITSALIGSLIGPLVILLVILLVGRTVFEPADEQPLELAVIGAENAPQLIRFLQQNNVVIRPAPSDPETAVHNGDVPVVLVIPPEYGAQFGAGQPAAVQLIVDNSRQASSPAIQRVSGLLEGYGRQIGALRLLARGISPSLPQAVVVEQVDVSTPQSRVLIFLNMLPYFLIFSVFSGGAAAIIDATAGERERNSLEPLLINPVSRRDLVLGKTFAALPFAFGTLLLTLGAFALIFNVVPLEDYVGFRFSIDLAALVGIFLLCIPLIALASALQMIIASFARTTKEAQSYVTWLPLIPALPGLALAFLPVKSQVWMMAIPSFGQQLLINQLMRGEPVAPLHLLVSVVVTLAAALALLMAAVRLYQREQVLFGRGG